MGVVIAQRALIRQILPADVLSVVFISPTHFQFNNLLGQINSWDLRNSDLEAVLAVPLLKIEIFEGITVRVGDIASVGLAISNGE